MKKSQQLKSDRKRKTLRVTSLSCDTDKFWLKKKRLCLKCGKNFLSENPYNRICGNCSLTNKRIELKTFYATSKHLNKTIH